MDIILVIKKEKRVDVELRVGDKTVGLKSLTTSQGFDTLLITAIDSLLVRSRIDRLSLKRLRIQGKVRPESISAMILKTLKSGIES